MKSSIRPERYLFAFVALALSMAGCSGCEKKKEEEVFITPPPDTGGRARLFRPEPDFGKDGGVRWRLIDRRDSGAPDAVAPAASVPVAPATSIE